MCGIFGSISPATINIERSRHSLQTLAHRGPDQWADWHDGQAYLGHRRLSIIDLSESGRQPMVSDDGAVVIIVNGEIYNYLHLRSQLQENYHFRSSSDSEVVLHGFRAWGIAGLLERIDGMFALAIYDTANKTVYLARDRVGIKPLHYSMIAGELTWASELKAIADYHNGNLTYDLTAAYDFLTYFYIPTPKTVYHDVFKLPPAHYLKFSVGDAQPSLARYWQLDPAPLSHDSVDQAAEKLRAHVDRAVAEQLMSDVPVGFFVSGGIDSSIVVAAAAKQGAVETFSIGFEVDTHDERPYAKQVADYFKTKHHEHVLQLPAVQRDFAKLRSWYDEPYADTSAFPTWLVSKFTRENCTVALSGDGGDEVFGGYTRYAEFVERGDTDADLAAFTEILGGLTKAQKQEFAQRWQIPADYDDYWYFRKFYRSDLPLRTRLQFLDFHTYLPDDILTKVDRVSMDVALEVRVPLLDTQLVEYAFSLPEEIRYYQDELKGLVKYAYQHELPAGITTRKKKGFSIPTGQWKGQLFPGIKYVQEAVIRNLFPELLDV